MTRDGYGAFPLSSPAGYAGSDSGCSAPPAGSREFFHGPFDRRAAFSAATSLGFETRPERDLDPPARPYRAPVGPRPGISAEGGWYLADRTFGS